MMVMVGRMTQGSQLQRISVLASIISLPTKSIKVATVTGCRHFRGMATFNYSSFVGPAPTSSTRATRVIPSRHVWWPSSQAVRHTTMQMDREEAR